jgi:hypothetical protein
MSIEPQYTFDDLGNPIGVFIPIKEWDHLAKELHLDIPQWTKDLIDSRLTEYSKAPDNTLDWDNISRELDKEDEAL